MNVLILVFCIYSFRRVSLTVGVKREGSPTEYVCKDNIGQVYSMLLDGLNDYTTDNRGDVGAWYVFADQVQCLYSAV